MVLLLIISASHLHVRKSTWSMGSTKAGVKKLRSLLNIGARSGRGEEGLHS